MAHLKKLSERLSMQMKPTVKKLVTILDGSDESTLQIESNRLPNITRKCKELYIPSLLMTAAYNKLPCLSATQIGIDISAMVVHKNLEPNKWSDYIGIESDYNVYINPLIKNISKERDLQLEECPSFPNIQAEIYRYKNIDIKYKNLQDQEIEESLEGFNARIFQKSIDLLWGFNIISFSVTNGKIKYKNPIENSVLDEVLEEFNKRMAEAKSRLEDRYIVDESFKENVDKSDADKNEYFERVILDYEFELEFFQNVSEAMKEDLLEEKKDDKSELDYESEPEPETKRRSKPNSKSNTHK
ncbi:unnamed protein product [Blepharisma stoltei]|uniref:Peptide deformylase n=1 Tax=Blepharisma stoltei TaxID=1481888 RepID=A0AAU9J8E8_9CILI|nr:unnamed protein product [Blepharisma stoltei]